MIELLIQAEQLLGLGMLDEAERLYSLAAEGDANNAMAVVGLSRVALERGDERAALDLARRALAIDPESSAAARMRDRIEEVIAWRGEPIPPDHSTAEPASPAPPAAAEPASAETASAEPAPPAPASAAQPAAASTSPKPSRGGLLRRLTRRS
ncbi:MAG: hypothetical protein MUC54_04765 [Chloroflexi bacterium]|nr:hypothetical protein [Chloroflexota bacterium]